MLHYTDGNGDLAIAEAIVLAWFGQDIPPSSHPLATMANSIVCPAMPEETQHREGLPWILFLARVLEIRFTLVDVYSQMGT